MVLAFGERSLSLLYIYIDNIYIYMHSIDGVLRISDDSFPDVSQLDEILLGQALNFMIPSALSRLVGFRVWKNPIGCSPSKCRHKKTHPEPEQRPF